MNWNTPGKIVQSYFRELGERERGHKEITPTLVARAYFELTGPLHERLRLAGVKIFLRINYSL